jgi:hypothetical protein
MKWIKKLRESVSARRKELAHRKNDYARLDQDERRSVNAYTWAGYKRINHFMRTPHERYESDPDDDEYDGSDQNQHREIAHRQIKHLNRAIQKHKTEHDHYVYRGVNPKRLPDDFHTNDKAEYHDKGFASTSRDPGTARAFGTTKVSGKHDRHVLKVRIPKGTHTYYHHEMAEHEHLLLPGKYKKFKPTKTYKHKTPYGDSTIHYHHVEYEPDHVSEAFITLAFAQMLLDESLAARRAERKKRAYDNDDLEYHEQSALRTYTGSGYKRINAHMNHGMTYDEDEDTDHEVHTIHRAVKKHSAEHDQHVYRAINHARLPKDWHTNDQAEWHHKSFISTSRHPHNAKEFGHAYKKPEYNYNPKDDDDEKVHHVMKIKIPKGTHSYYTDHMGEKEHVLLPGKLKKSRPSSEHTDVHGGRYVYHHAEYHSDHMSEAFLAMLPYLLEMKI